MKIISKLPPFVGEKRMGLRPHAIHVIRGMRTHQRWLQRIAKAGLTLMMVASMNANAGWFGFGGDSWKEEVLLHDGSEIIAKRSLSYGGRHEIGQPSPIKEQTISFTLPNADKAIQWTSEFSEDVGRANFNLLALHVLNGTPYIVVEPNLCLSYNKWGRPNPPYVFFKYDGKGWQRIPLSEFPSEFKTLNVAINLGHQKVELMEREGLVPSETIKRRNAELEYNYPQYRGILRETYSGAAGGCMDEIRTGDGWKSIASRVSLPRRIITATSTSYRNRWPISLSGARDKVARWRAQGLSVQRVGLALRLAIRCRAGVLECYNSPRFFDLRKSAKC